MATATKERRLSAQRMALRKALRLLVKAVKGLEDERNRVGTVRELNAALRERDAALDYAKVTLQQTKKIE